MEASQQAPFLRSFASVAVGNYVAIGLSVFASAVLARRLGAEGFGRLALVMMAVLVLSNTVFTWTLSGLVKFGALEFAKRGSVSETFWARLSIVAPGVLIAALALRLSQESAATYLGIPVWAVWLTFGYFVVSQLLLTIGSVFQATEMMSKYAATLWIDKAITLLAVLTLPGAYAKEPVAIVACYTASSALVLCWALASLDHRLVLPIRFNGATVLDLWRFSIPVLFWGLSGVVGGQAMTLAIVNHFYSATDLGVYSLANQVVGVLQQIGIVVSLVLLPRLSVMVGERRHEHVQMLVERIMPYGLLGVSVLFSASALIGQLAIPLIFGPTFAASVPLLTILIVGSMALSFFAVFVPFFNAYGLTWTLTSISVVTAAVNLTSNLLLVPRYGPLGASLASVLASTTAGALALTAVRRRFRTGALRFALLSVPVVVVAASNLLLEGGVAYLAGIVALAVSTCVLVVRLHLFGGDDLAVLRRIGIHLPFLERLGKWREATRLI